MAGANKGSNTGIQSLKAVASQYDAQMTALSAEIDASLDATDPSVVKAKADAAFRRLDASNIGATRQDFDPLQLPNRALQPDLNRKPATTAAAYPMSFYSSVQLAALDPTAFDISALPAAADPALRQATTEVTLSPDIIAKADALHGNPVEIYNWVRNNVQWQPTWGAIQSASHTLSSQRGNAFDISSLIIALLRASGVPARYVHGTI